MKIFIVGSPEEVLTGVGLTLAQRKFTPEELKLNLGRLAEIKVFLALTDAIFYSQSQTQRLKTKMFLPVSKKIAPVIHMSIDDIELQKIQKMPDRRCQLVKRPLQYKNLRRFVAWLAKKSRS